MNETKRKVRLYGALGAKFGRVHELVVSSPAEAVRALALQLPGFEDFMKGTKHQYAVLVGRRHLNLATKLDELHEPTGSADIRIAPVPAGAKRGGLFQVVLGAVMIAGAFFTGGATLAAWGTMSTMMFSMGVSLALGGIAQMLSPQPSLSMGKAAENTASAYFNGPAQTTPQGNPVPIFYGEGIVGSMPISAGIYAENSN